ncbi:MAG TPA: hypothetical protein VIV60_37385, partial [Polyangiaceae bacterium]
MYSLRFAALIPVCLTAVTATTVGAAQTGTPPVTPRGSGTTTPLNPADSAPTPRDDRSSTAQPVNAGTATTNEDFEVDAKPPSSAPTSNPAPAASTQSVPAVAPIAAPTEARRAQVAPGSDIPVPAVGTATPSAAGTAVALSPPSPPALVDANRIVDISGYGQFQYEAHQDSEDQLRQGGTLINQDRFSVRRLRIELSRRFAYSGYFVEIDGNTTNGPALSLMRAEGSLFYQGNPKDQPPLIELTLGQLKVPFGFEVPESPR